MNEFKPIKGNGPMDAEILILVDRPSPDSVREERPLAGKSRKIMKKWLSEFADIRLIDCYTTLLVKIRAEDPPLGSQGHWMPSLLKEIRTVQPLVIIAAGAESTRALLQIKGSVSTFRGHLSMGLLGYPVFPIYSPTKKGITEAVVKADLMQLREWLDNQS